MLGVADLITVAMHDNFGGHVKPLQTGNADGVIRRVKRRPLRHRNHLARAKPFLANSEEGSLALDNTF